VAHGIVFAANTSRFKVIGCTASNGLLGSNQQSGIFVNTGCAKFRLVDNDVEGNLGAGIVDGSGAINSKFIRGYNGYVTQAKGSAVILSGTTSIVVTHGLSATPTNLDVQLQRLGTNAGSTDLFADTFTATQFTIRTAAAPSSNITIRWEARIAGA
jgi:hypothetical protein